MTGRRNPSYVKVRAKSPGKYPILVVELPDGNLRAAYYETGYDLARTKTVSQQWLVENAIGRHSFAGVEPPEEVEAAALQDYATKRASGS